MEEETKTDSNSSKYIIWGLIILVVFGVGGYLLTKGSENNATPEEVVESPLPQTTDASSLNGQPFSGSQYASSAVLIYPGVLSAEAKVATSGWQIKSKVLTDKSTQVDLIPTGSEATEGDSSHTFNLKAGYKLYFVDLNPNDDKTGQDNNANDDMGILVDANGLIVQ